MVDEKKVREGEVGTESLGEGRRKKRPTSTEIIKELEDARKKLQEEAKGNYDRFLRVAADFENYKKRVAREKTELIKYGNEELIKELLPVLDNLERALEHASGEGGTDGIIEGVEMILVQFLQILQRVGVTPLSAIGERFDPALHEAVMEMETAEYDPGYVASEMQKGYQLNDRLLRPAKVVVAKHQGSAEKEDA
jgi:molecular chaperone GrpE